MTPSASWLVEDGVIRENGILGSGLGDIGRVVIEAPKVTRAARPGQFVMVRCWETEPLLPRAMAPLSYDIASGCMEIFYRIKGPGTEALARSRAGDIACVTGPLGRPVLDDFDGLNVALVGRGVGITPSSRWRNTLFVPGGPFAPTSPRALEHTLDWTSSPTSARSTRSPMTKTAKAAW